MNNLREDFDLEAYYERKYREKYVKELEKKDKMAKFENKVNKINEEFNENYIV